MWHITHHQKSSSTEIGHNFNLAHSGGLDGKTYTDHTGMMGNPLYSDDIGAMCWDAAKSYQIGWYDNSTITISPKTEGTWIGSVAGVADFDNNPNNLPVVVKIETGTGTDQYIAFNRKKGVNRQMKQAGDEVTIVQTGKNGEGYSQSFLKATLKQGQEYVFEKWDGLKDLTVKAQSINIDSNGDAMATDYAEVSVCLGTCEIPDTIEHSSNPSTNPLALPSKEPSTSPTSTPSKVPTSVPSILPSHTSTTSQPSMSPSTNPSTEPSKQPSVFPTMRPTTDPSVGPSNAPTVRPTSIPSVQPSASPTEYPSTKPSKYPSAEPTEGPSNDPSVAPTESTSEPTQAPSGLPTSIPSGIPTSIPSNLPSEHPTLNPSNAPSKLPTEEPSHSPSQFPSVSVSASPSATPSESPTSVPSAVPSHAPTKEPTEGPSNYPSVAPTESTSEPSQAPSGLPTSIPSGIPTSIPSNLPSEHPTLNPSNAPSKLPTEEPSHSPSQFPSVSVSASPSATPSESPTSVPSAVTSHAPTRESSNSPSRLPTSQPSTRLSTSPSTDKSNQPSSFPTMRPTTQLSETPSGEPSPSPTLSHTASPATVPSQQPSTASKQRYTHSPNSVVPTSLPTAAPITSPSVHPSTQPTQFPSDKPSLKPSVDPSSEPSMTPTASPTVSPSISPSSLPSILTTAAPTHDPTASPSKSPSLAPTLNATSSSPSMKPATEDDSDVLEDGNFHYSQMGLEFDGRVRDDFLGTSVLISSNGLRVAVASPGNSLGYVGVYDWIEEAWQEIGGIILGHEGAAHLGYAMAMNSDGSRIIFGSPEVRNDDGSVHVYEFDADANEWMVLGDVIRPVRNTKGHAGGSVAISGDGNRIAYGSPRANWYRGGVTVLEFDIDTKQWIQMGEHLGTDHNYYASTGGSIAMSADGNKLVVGSSYGGWFLGNVEIFECDTTSNQWSLSGSIDGSGYYDRFGGDVDISDDGNTIVVGGAGVDNTEGGTYSKNVGEFKVFTHDGLSWNQLGHEVIGEEKYDKMGESVAISGDGKRVAVSSPKSDNDGRNNNGKAQLFSYDDDSDTWISTIEIRGDCNNDRLGESSGAIAMDYHGHHIIVGAQRGHYYEGKARVYEAVQGQTEETVNLESNPMCTR